jgi:hypothetical protein
MTIKSIYSTQDEIPENYRDLFEERNGAYHLTKIEGIKTDADVSRVQTALTNERNEHTKLKNQVKTFVGEGSFDDIQAKLDRIPELEQLAEGKVDEEKINSLVEARLKTKLAPVERERDQLATKLSERDEVISGYETKERQRNIHDAVRQAATKLKVIDTAQEDVLMLAERVFEIQDDGSITAKDGVGVTPGVAPDIWLTEMQSKRPHWWAASSGGGARGSGSGGNLSGNPWSADSWNMTKQGQIIRSEGMEKAQQMAQAAGSKVGAIAPTAKK